jgi:predicted branched-subunit amino acid permease
VSILIGRIWTVTALRERLGPGARAGIPFAVAAVILGASFGVTAEPVLGPAATIVMSAALFAGAAQFGSTAVLAAGGGAPAAIAAGTLLNARFLPMGVAAAPSLTGRRLSRAAQGQAIVDASWALAARSDKGFDRDLMLGATLPQYPLWIIGTAIGAFAGDVLGDPKTFGIDAIFPAFFLSLLADELRARRGAVAAALIGGGIALVLVPLAPPGVPVLTASLAALIGLRRS